MFHQKILILENKDNLSSLTINSIKNNCPGWDYQVLQIEGGRVPTVLNYAKENLQGIYLVVNCGVILKLNKDSLPPTQLLEKHHMIVDKLGVYFGSSLYEEYYKKEKINYSSNLLDLSVFIINTEKFDFIPETDAGFMSKISTRYLPRYMNHKYDPLMDEIVNARHLFKYGVEGEKACVHNYVPLILKGDIPVSLTYSLCFEKLLQHVNEDVPQIYRNNINKIMKRYSNRIETMRTKYYDVYKDYKNGKL